MEPAGITALILVALAAAFDMRTRRVPNWLTKGGVLVGVILNTAFGGVPGGLDHGLLGSIVGMTMVGAPSFLLFLTRRNGVPLIGGGDVKLMAALGAIWGMHWALWASFVGVALAFAFVLLKHAWFGRLGNYLFNVVKLPVSQATEIDERLLLAPWLALGVLAVVATKGFVGGP